MILNEINLHQQFKCNLCQTVATHFHHYIDKTEMKITRVSFCGPCHFSIIGVYSSARQERVKAKMAENNAAGKKMPGRRRSYDYAKIKELREAGLSLSQIASQVGGSRSAIAKAVENIRNNNA